MGEKKTPTPSPSQEAAAYERIKELVVTLQLPPNSPIDVRRLGQDVGAPRGPVREALQRLAREMLVTVSPRRGTFVMDLGISRLQQAFDLRLLLEPFAMRLAASRATAVEITSMNEVLNLMEEAVPDGSYRKYIGLEDRLHREIARASRHDFTIEFIDTVLPATERFWYTIYSTNSTDEVVCLLSTGVASHYALVEAIANRETEQSEALMRLHIREGFAVAFRSFSSLKL